MNGFDDPPQGHGYYTLDKDHNVIPVTGPDAGLRAFENFSGPDSDWRVVAQTELPNGYFVSTVFLALDHSWLRWDQNHGEPLVFETMVFDGGDRSDLDMERYSTWKQADKGHKKMVKKWKGKINHAKKI